MRFAFGNNRRDYIARYGVDHIPLRTFKRGHVQCLAVGRDRHAIATIGVVAFLPDDLVGREIESRETARCADVEPASGGVRSNALDRLNGLTAVGFPGRNTPDELMTVIGVEHENADAARFLVV